MSDPGSPARLSTSLGRRVTLPLAVLALAVGGAACSSSGNPAPSSSSSSGPAARLVATSPPAKGDLASLTWDLPTGEPTTLDYVKAGDYSPDTVISNLCDSLLRLKPDFSFGPNLATSWSYGTGHMSLTFTLRSGVTFWDGHPLTAQDVAYSLLRNMNPKNSPVNGAFFASVKSITATGTHTVVVQFKRPDELFIKEMATVAGDVSEEQFTKAKGSSYGTAQGGVMCSGPFDLDKWSPGQNITLTANTHYWNNAYKPRAKKVTLDFITDTASLVQALKSGAVQGAFEAPISELPALEADSSGTVYQGKSLAIYELVSNLPGPDVKIKMALSMVIDRTAMANVVFHDAASPNYALIPPSAWDPTAIGTYQAALAAMPKATTVDKAAAKKVIAGDPQVSKPITLGILAGDQTEINTATLIQQEAATIGLKISIKQLQPLQFSNAFYVPSARKGLGLILTKGYLDVPDPLDYLGLIVLPTSIFNWTHFDNPTVSKDVALAQQTFDNAKRAKLITSAQAQWEAAHMIVPMLSLHEVVFMNKAITGAPVSFAYIYEPSLATVGSSK
ncbi:MAG TPA: ABC transporter substrate-binding protein [Streptosporangiaceae bacterium]|nr:ABC transporter substrate-binding protein [Streptosporangiaceae bacterium]